MTYGVKVGIAVADVAGVTVNVGKAGWGVGEKRTVGGGGASTGATQAVRVRISRGRNDRFMGGPFK